MTFSLIDRQANSLLSIQHFKVTEEQPAALIVNKGTDVL